MSFDLLRIAGDALDGEAFCVGAEAAREPSWHEYEAPETVVDAWLETLSEFTCTLSPVASIIVSVHHRCSTCRCTYQECTCDEPF